MLNGQIKNDLDEWFEQHKDILAGLLRNDQEEALWLAWYAGYQKGLESASEIEKEFWTLK
jgi:hypothetical protein